MAQYFYGNGALNSPFLSLGLLANLQKFLKQLLHKMGADLRL
jgi:hypothetical protein